MSPDGKTTAACNPMSGGCKALSDMRGEVTRELNEKMEKAIREIRADMTSIQRWLIGTFSMVATGVIIAIFKWALSML